MVKPDAQPVRLSKKLLVQIKKRTAETGRTVPAEIEHRLELSLEGPATAMPPWARAVSESIARLAREIEEIGTGPEVRFGMLCEAVELLLLQLRPADSKLNKDDQEMVRVLVTYLVQKIRRERGGILEGLPRE